MPEVKPEWDFTDWTDEQLKELDVLVQLEWVRRMKTWSFRKLNRVRNEAWELLNRPRAFPSEARIRKAVHGIQKDIDQLGKDPLPTLSYKFDDIETRGRIIRKTDRDKYD